MMLAGRLGQAVTGNALKAGRGMEAFAPAKAAREAAADFQAGRAGNYAATAEGMESVASNLDSRRLITRQAV